MIRSFREAEPRIDVSLIEMFTIELRAHGVVYRRLGDAHVTSPIIISRRLHDVSAATSLFCDLAREKFKQTQ